MGKKSLRPAPKGFFKRELEYRTTIIGENGRLDDLERTIKQSSSRQPTGDPTQAGTTGSSTVYWIGKDPVEFDVYQSVNCKGPDTPVFRQSVGEILTGLLQCGYTIRHENKRNELGPQPPKDKRPNHDF